MRTYSSARGVRAAYLQDEVDTIEHASVRFAARRVAVVTVLSRASSAAGAA